MGEQVYPDSSTNDNLVTLFHRASRMMARAFHRHAQPHHAQARVLSIIQEHGSISQRELLGILDVRSASLSEVLAKLERNGMIVRERNPEDKRGFIISALEKKENTPFQREQGLEHPDTDLFFGSLETEEKEQLAYLLQKIIRTAEQDGSLYASGRHHDICSTRATGRGRGHGKKFSGGRGARKRSRHS